MPRPPREYPNTFQITGQRLPDGQADQTVREVSFIEITGPDGGTYRISAYPSGGLRIEAGTYQHGSMLMAPQAHNSVVVKLARMDDAPGLEEF